MRKFAIERLLAGTALSFAVMTPGLAAPSVRSVAPPPATINDYQPHRNAAPAIISVPRQDRYQDKYQERYQDRYQERPQEKIQDKAVIEPPPPVAIPAPVAESSGIDLKGALDKLLAASDSQVSDRLRSIASGRQLDRLMPRQAERSAAETFYKSHN